MSRGGAAVAAAPDALPRRVGYLDVPCGVTGEMMLGCLVDCGWSESRLREQLSLLTVRWACAVEAVVKGPLRATVVDVMVDDAEMETAAIVAAVGCGLNELGIETLYAGEVKPSRIVAEPLLDESAKRILMQATLSQPAMRLERVGVGAHRDDRAWPNVARLWVGTETSRGSL